MLNSCLQSFLIFFVPSELHKMADKQHLIFLSCSRGINLFLHHLYALFHTLIETQNSQSGAYDLSAMVSPYLW